MYFYRPCLWPLDTVNSPNLNSKFCAVDTVFLLHEPLPPTSSPRFNFSHPRLLNKTPRTRLFLRSRSHGWILCWMNHARCECEQPKLTWNGHPQSHRLIHAIPRLTTLEFRMKNCVVRQSNNLHAGLNAWSVSWQIKLSATVEIHTRSKAAIRNLASSESTFPTLKGLTCLPWIVIQTQCARNDRVVFHSTQLLLIVDSAIFFINSPCEDWGKTCRTLKSKLTLK